MSITPNAPSAAAIDAKIKALATPDITPADLADQVLAQYTDLDTLKADIRWLLAEYGERQQRLLAMKVDTKPKRSHRKPATSTGTTTTTLAPIPYGDPESHVKMPNGGVRKWSGLSADEHEAVAAALTAQGVTCLERAELHRNAAATMRLAAA